MSTKRLFILEFFVYLCGVIGLYGYQYVNWGGDYLDTDNYTHAIRLTEFIKHPSYWEQPFLFTNYPFGEILHWTRALDICWEIIALPFGIFFDLKEAVFYSGLLIAPLFCVGAVWYWLKSCRMLFDWRYRILFAVLLLVQSNFLRVLFLNRPDHHAAFVFLQAFLIYYVFEYIRTLEFKYLFKAASGAAFALFMAAEGVLLFIGIGAFLIYGWLFLKYSYADLRRFCACYAFFITIFLLINPPYEGFLFMDSGRLSCFYVMAGWMVYFIVCGAQFFVSRFIRLLNIGGGCLLLIWGYQICGWLVSPLDERIMVPFVNRIGEMSSGNIYTMAYPVFGLWFGILLIKQYRNNGLLVFLFINLLLYGILSAFSVRFLPYAAVLATFLLTLYVADVISKKRRILLIGVFIGLEYITFVLHVLFSYSIDELEKKVHIPMLNMPIEYLAKIPRGTFASDIFAAPYIIWYGGHSVIASPYHRNVEGILDNHLIFFSDDEAEVSALLKKHQVKYVLLFDDLDEEYYQKPKQNCDKLYGMILGCHNYPAWLVPDHIGDGYYLFKVDWKAN